MKPLGVGIVVAAGLMTSACGTSSPGAQATHTVTATVTPAPASSTPTPSPTASSSPAAAGCLSRYLHASVGQSSGAAGSVTVPVVFKNLDNVPCTLYGYPGVSLAAGTPVTDVGQPSTENAATPRELVTLAPHGYASALLQVVDALNYPAGRCHPVKASWLAVIPPNQKVPLYIPFDSYGCKSATVKMLTVNAVRPGTSGT